MKLASNSLQPVGKSNLMRITHAHCVCVDKGAQGRMASMISIKFRIFVSSPGDVAEERVIAERNPAAAR